MLPKIYNQISSRSAWYSIAWIRKKKGHLPARFSASHNNQADHFNNGTSDHCWLHSYSNYYYRCVLLENMSSSIWLQEYTFDHGHLILAYNLSCGVGIFLLVMGQLWMSWLQRPISYVLLLFVLHPHQNVKDKVTKDRPHQKLCLTAKANDSVQTPLSIQPDYMEESIM